MVRGWLLRAGPVVKSLQRQKALEEQSLWGEAARARGQLAGDLKGTAAIVARSKGRAKEGTGVGVVAHGRGVGGGDPREIGVVGDEYSEQAGKGESPPRGASLSGATCADDLDRVVAVLCLLGGQFEGLYPGARVLCRLPPEEGVSSDPLSGWKDSPAVEVTVLRLGLSGTEPRRIDVEPRGEDISSSGKSVVDDVSASGRGTVGSPQVRRQQQQQPVAVRAACPVFSASLVPRRPGCGSPQDFYEGLSDEVYAGGLAAAVVAREVIRAERLQQQQGQMELERERQSVSARLEHARLGSVSREHGRSSGISSLRGPPAPVFIPDTREPAELFLPTVDGGDSGGSASTSRRQQQQQQRRRRQRPASRRQELVSVGVSRKDRGSAPHVVTVPVDSVELLRTEVPQALLETLTSHVEDILPGLKAMLEAETAFKGEHSEAELAKVLYGSVFFSGGYGA